MGLALGLVLSLCGSALEWKATRLAVATAPFQQTQDVTFEFANRGASAVTIRDVQTSCDCLEATLARKTYQPGEAGAIQARFTVGDRIGIYERVITVVTDEPGDPVRLHLQIEVPAAAVLEPRTVSWTKGEAGAEKLIALTAAPGLLIDFSTASPTNDAFAVRLETLEPGRSYRLRISARDTKQPASAAIRVFGRERSGHDLVISAYSTVE